MSDQIDVNELSNAIQEKMDLDMGNLSSSGKQQVVSWGMPDYNNGQSITQNTDYTLPKDGVVFMTATATSTGASTQVVLTVKDSQGNTLFTMGNRFQKDGAGASPSSILIPLQKGMIVNGYGAGVLVIFNFYPMKGA